MDLGDMIAGFTAVDGAGWGVMIPQPMVDNPNDAAVALEFFQAIQHQGAEFHFRLGELARQCFQFLGHRDGLLVAGLGVVVKSDQTILRVQGFDSSPDQRAVDRASLIEHVQSAVQGRHPVGQLQHLALPFAGHDIEEFLQSRDSFLGLIVGQQERRLCRRDLRAIERLQTL